VLHIPTAVLLSDLTVFDKCVNVIYCTTGKCKKEIYRNRIL